jgi:hypothetical protein
MRQHHKSFFSRSDIWDAHKAGIPIVITINGNVGKKGHAVMGKGIALEARNKYRHLSKQLGAYLTNNPFRTFYWSEYNLFTFPTKYNWWEKANLNLIVESANGLLDYVNNMRLVEVYMPAVGCGNGGLRWENVKPALDFLDDRFVVCV